MMRLSIYRKDMELVVFRGFNLINHEDPIHDAPFDLSEGHGVSGLSWFQLNKSRRSNT
jgi:hypothetical protein